MYTADTFRFLSELKENNYREWFQENKKSYEAVKKELTTVTNALVAGIATFDAGVKDLTAKDCIFRINRDIRFSQDKSPYKTNLGIFIAEGGKKSGLAGYYLHTEPGSCFIAGGCYMPPSPVLKAIRTEIYNYSDEFLEITDNPHFKKAFNGIDQEVKLKTAPKGFDKNFEHIDWLRHKSYTVSVKVSCDLLMSQEGFDKSLAIYKTMHPFIAFLNRAIKEN